MKQEEQTVIRKDDWQPIEIEILDKIDETINSFVETPSDIYSIIIDFKKSIELLPETFGKQWLLEAIKRSYSGDVRRLEQLIEIKKDNEQIVDISEEKKLAWVKSYNMAQISKEFFELFLMSYEDIEIKKMGLRFQNKKQKKMKIYEKENLHKLPKYFWKHPEIKRLMDKSEDSIKIYELVRVGICDCVCSDDTYQKMRHTNQEKRDAPFMNHFLQKNNGKELNIFVQTDLSIDYKKSCNVLIETLNGEPLVV